LENNPYLRAYAEMAPYMKSWGMGDQSYVEMILNNAITEVIQDQRDIEITLRNAEQDINDQLAETNN
jgi:hypothetical protein